MINTILRSLTLTIGVILIANGVKIGPDAWGFIALSLGGGVLGLHVCIRQPSHD
jgi:hypothetical protein